MKAGFVFAIYLVLSSLVAGLAHAAEHKSKSNGIHYVSGGIGLESRERLRAKQDSYNLMVLLAQSDGHYLGGADITISDRGGKPLLTTQVKGPWLLVKLPPGDYTVHAKARNAVQRAHVVVAENGLKRVRLTWEPQAS
jgi:hypothetical protein